MFSKQSLFLLILVAVIFSMSAVSAMDADNGTLETADAMDYGHDFLSLNDLSDNNLKTDISDLDELDDNVSDSQDDEALYSENDCGAEKTGDSENEGFEMGNFEDLSEEINLTPEGGILILDMDYEYINGSVKGIVVSKSITIDGAGHTLNGNKLSRIFNVTADNVTIRNINFKDGDSLGSYGICYGGGAIYWKGNDGYVENCNFTGNSLYSFEYNPYGQGEVIVDENGLSHEVHVEAPDGATTAQGGAITWIGDRGKIVNSTFKSNSVGYANDGGAIFWEGANGKIINSEFYDNDAFRGSAIYWKGENGTISLSTFMNSGICDNGIFWVGENGVIRNSILLSSYGSGNVISQYSAKVTADFNYWGDTLDNPDGHNKSSNVRYWVLMNFTPDTDFVFENESFTVNYYFANVIDSSGQIYDYSGLVSKSGSVEFISNRTGILNLTFDDEFKFDVVPYNSSGDFYDLLIKIRETPEGGILVLDRDYEFVEGFANGILISKSITIDGAGHTLNGNRMSRIFNITADNVTVKNINFINGTAFGRYFSKIVGGGAIYWSGANGYLLNCSFANNYGGKIEYDPFDREGISVDENGMIWYTMRMRPMGMKTNEGGAIVWNGVNGTVDRCLFKDNGVGYPNSGGAICWRGDDGRILESKFLRNDAWCGSAVAWIGDNGTILSSIFAQTSFFDGGIYWFGHNGTIKYSILLGNNNRGALRSSGGEVNADFNFWGDILDDSAAIEKINNVSNWFVMNITHNSELVKKGQTLTISYGITNLMDKDGNVIDYSEFTRELNGMVNYTASKTGYLKIAWAYDNVSIKIDSKDKISGKDLTKYYAGKTSFKVKVSDISGKIVGKKVKFTINGNKYYRTTDKNGVATLKLKLKPEKYTVYTSYGDVKVKNRIVIKKVLITKNLSKKVKKSAKFKVKVLNSKGKAFSKQVVKVKFKGKTYKIKTNKKGIATFKVSKKLKAGKYTIKTTYKGLTVSNKIVVRK